MYLPGLGNGSSVQSLRVHPNFDLARGSSLLVVRVFQELPRSTRIYSQKSEKRNCRRVDKLVNPAESVIRRWDLVPSAGGRGRRGHRTAGGISDRFERQDST
jgi:hypothetical protein